MKKVLLIDHYDSFTYNLVQYLQEIGAEVVVSRCDEINPEEVAILQPDFLIFSPGPGSVEKKKDVGMSPEIFNFFRGKIPILGVCLGHQMIGHLFGGKIQRVAPVHGKRWPIKIMQKTGIFQDFPDEISGMRYHSLVVGRDSFPENLNITAQTHDEEKLIMAFEKTDEKIYGIQFHPESIGTESGMHILENFLKI